MSGVALTLRQTLVVICLQAMERRGGEHPAYAPNWSMVHFTFTFSSSGVFVRQLMIFALTAIGCGVNAHCVGFYS